MSKKPIVRYFIDENYTPPILLAYTMYSKNVHRYNGFAVDGDIKVFQKGTRDNKWGECTLHFNWCKEHCREITEEEAIKLSEETTEGN